MQYFHTAREDLGNDEFCTVSETLLDFMPVQYVQTIQDSVMISPRISMHFHSKN